MYSVTDVADFNQKSANPECSIVLTDELVCQYYRPWHDSRGNEYSQVWTCIGHEVHEWLMVHTHITAEVIEHLTLCVIQFQNPSDMIQFKLSFDWNT